MLYLFSSDVKNRKMDGDVTILSNLPDVQYFMSNIRKYLDKNTHDK